MGRGDLVNDGGGQTRRGEVVNDGLDLDDRGGNSEGPALDVVSEFRVRVHQSSHKKINTPDSIEPTRMESRPPSVEKT